MSIHTTIFDNGDFRLHAKISVVSSPKDGYAITITSKLNSSRNPDDEHVRFFACLDREGLLSLSKLFQNALIGDL